MVPKLILLIFCLSMVSAFTLDDTTIYTSISNFTLNNIPNDGNLLAVKGG